MPGICGWSGSMSEAQGCSLLTEMVRALTHHSWYRAEEACAGEAGLGRVSLGFINTARQPASNEDGTLHAVMDGELYESASLQAELRAAGHVFRGTGHAELLVHGFEQEGPAFFARLNGCFAAGLWDARRRRLYLINDRFGLKPLYYAAVPGKFLFASEIKAILQEPAVTRRIRTRGLSQFFTFGQLLAEDTLWEGIHLLPAAGLLTYDVAGDKIELRRWCEFRAPEIDATLSAQGHLERIEQAFKRAVERRSRDTGNLGLSLSGGLDARTILGVVDDAVPLQTITMGIDGSIDHQCAAELARLTNRPHHRYVLNTDFLCQFEDHLRRMVHLTDGHYLSQCIVMPTLPVYRDCGIDVLLRGHAGELMHMDKAYNFSLDSAALGLRDEASLEQWLMQRLAGHMSRELRDRLFAPAYQQEIDGLARDSLQECLRQSAGMAPPVHRIWHLFWTQRTRRETAMSMTKFGSVVETRLPYLDQDVVEALLAAPPELKIGDRIQSFILERRRPEFLRVVNANTGARMGAGRFARKLAGLRLKVLAKLGVRGYQPYERLGRWLRQELRPLVDKLLLKSSLLDRGYFNPLTIRGIVDGHLNRGENHTFLLMALMIFEAGQQEFADGCGPAQENHAKTHMAVA